MFKQVTIGVPTFNRPNLLFRALTCISEQSYPNLEVIVADNCSPEYETKKVVDSFKNKIGNLRYVRRESNIGAVANNLRLRDEASGEYFMWLADDDEITNNYVSSLVDVLDKNSDVVCAMGKYIQRRGSKNVFMDNKGFMQDSAFKRVLGFMWRSDDAFYYGLHRIGSIKKASFIKYWFPNKNSIDHNAYMLMLDIVLNGKVMVVGDESVQWINNHFSKKNYLQKESFVETVFCFLTLRMNYLVYCWKKIIGSLGFLRFITDFFVSIVSQVTDLALVFGGVSAGMSGDSLVKKFLNRKNLEGGGWFRDREI